MTDTILLSTITHYGRTKYIDLKLNKVYYARVAYDIPATTRILKRPHRTAAQSDAYSRRFVARCHRLAAHKVQTDPTLCPYCFTPMALVEDEENGDHYVCTQCDMVDDRY